MKALAHMDGELVMELTERAENSKGAAEATSLLCSTLFGGI